MKIKCAFCDRIYADTTEPCPGCGAYNEAPEEPAFRYVAPPQPQIHTKPKRSYAVRIVTLSMSLIFLVGLFFFLSDNPERISDVGIVQAVDQQSVLELYEILSENPADFDSVYKLTTILYSTNKQSEAREIAMYLLREQCTDVLFFRNIAESMLKYGDKSYACRMYLRAYQLSGNIADLDSATECGSPGELMPTGPTSQSLEFFFRKPMSLITWAEIGEVKYFAPHYDYIEMSLADPAEVEFNFKDTLQAFRFDRSEDSSFAYLYGLRELDVYTRLNFSDTNLFALQELHTLKISNLSNSPNLSAIANIPLLQNLHVGGTNITTLDGLDRLPKLQSLSLQGTSIESLSILASYRNIKSLSLNNNKNLTGLSSLEMMDHLEGLHVERQEVLDFRFLEKMHSLKELSLINTAIKDIFFLAQLDTLEALTINKNDDLKSISGIGELTGLKRLAVSANKFDISGLEEIANLTNLEWLRLYNPTSISMISGITSIKALELNSLSMLDSLAPAANLINLESFSVDAADYGYFDASLAPLASLPKLTHVSIPGWTLYYSNALFGIKTLEYLDLTGCRLEFSSAGLSGLDNVKTLKLGSTKWLANVRIWGSGGITNHSWDNVDTDRAVSTVTGLANLERLELAKTELADIEFVPSLPSLTYLDLSDNYITDISSLSEATELREVNLSGNPVRDWSIAESWTHIYVVR